MLLARVVERAADPPVVMRTKTTSTTLGAVAAAAMVLAGCDPATGVIRTARLETIPSTLSVRDALDAVPEVQEVHYTKVQPSVAWSLYEGRIESPAYDQFSYRGSGTGGTLEVRETEKGEKSLRLYYVQIGTPLSRNVVDQARGLMDKIYASLHARVAQIPPPAQVHEELIRVTD